MAEQTTAIKERPILFSAPMVRAILAGKKTQTRRIVKVPSWGDCDIELCDKSGQGQSAIDWPNVVCKTTGCLAEIASPYGAASMGMPGPIYLFAMLWEKINGAGSWNRDPLVWVVSFARIKS